MMARMPPEVSYGQNGEDIILWRVFAGRDDGRYVEVGANHPTDLSVSRSFYDAGWSGIAVEPQPAVAAEFRRERPRDVVVEVAVTDSSEPAIAFFELPGADGLSTTDAEYAHKHGESGLEVQEITVRTCRLDDLLSRHLSPGDDIHFMVVDVEGGEASALASNDWTTWRPWVLVVEAVAPMTATDLEEHTDPVVTHDAWEPALLEAGYRFCMFDGLSRFYVAEEHADELAAKLSYPAGVLDQRTHISHAEKAALQHAASAARQEAEQLRQERAALEAERDELRSQVVYWRGDVLRFWSSLAAKTPVVDFVSEDGTASAELEAMRNTISWKVTKPLRTVRGGPVHRVARHLPPNVKSAARQLLGKG